MAPQADRDVIRDGIRRAILERCGGATADVLAFAHGYAKVSRARVLAELRAMEAEGLLERFPNPPGRREGWRETARPKAPDLLARWSAHAESLFRDGALDPSAVTVAAAILTAAEHIASAIRGERA